MNFLNKLKKEIYLSKPDSACCYLSFLYGTVLSSGELGIEKNQFYLIIPAPDEEFYTFVNKLIKKIYGEETVLFTDDTFFNKEKLYIKVPLSASKKIFKDLDILSSNLSGTEINFNFNNELVNLECCKISFIKGVFASIGTSNIKINEEEFNEKTSSGYHLEFVFKNNKLHSEIMHLLAEIDVYSSSIERNNKFVVYISGFQNVLTFLAKLSLNKTLFSLENENIARDMRKSANRELNSLTANLNKQIETAAKQVKIIIEIDNMLGLENLPGGLKVVAKARLENPEANLAELSEVLGGGITKSGINHRFNRLTKIYENLTK